MEGKKGSVVRGVLFAGIAVGTVLLSAAIVLFTPLNRLLNKIPRKNAEAPEETTADEKLSPRQRKATVRAAELIYKPRPLGE